MPKNRHPFVPTKTEPVETESEIKPAETESEIKSAETESEIKPAETEPEIKPAEKPEEAKPKTPVEEFKEHLYHEFMAQVKKYVSEKIRDIKKEFQAALALLTKRVDDLQTENVDLRKRVDDLQTENVDLRKMVEALKSAFATMTVAQEEPVGDPDPTKSLPASDDQGEGAGKEVNAMPVRLTLADFPDDLRAKVEKALKTRYDADAEVRQLIEEMLKRRAAELAKATAEKAVTERFERDLAAIASEITTTTEE